MLKPAYFIFVLFPGWLILQHIQPSDKDSSVKFSIRNFGSEVTGSFKGLKGNIQFDPAKPGASLFDVTIESSSIYTGNGWRDSDLRAAKYFDVKNYPQIRMVSTSVTPGRETGSFNFQGKLTIKKTTKDISFPFKAVREGEGWRFTGNFGLNRRDFDVGNASISLSDNLTVSLAVFAK